MKDTVEIKLDSCEANLLVVKSFPRIRGVDPLYGVDINGTAAIFPACAGLFPEYWRRTSRAPSSPRTRGVVPNSMLEAQHSGTPFPAHAGFSVIFTTGTGVLSYEHLTTNKPTA